jgi:DNA polymerase I-like protein with 3'-5' exonuclease and polymerase domains
LTEAVSHDVVSLGKALQITKRPVVIDTETTGLDVLCSRVLSLGLRVHDRYDWKNFVLFTPSCYHVSIQPFVTPWPAIHQALNYLHQPKMILVGHNLKYDLLMLRREGFTYRGGSRDTLSLLRLEDQDRGFSKDTVGRRYLKADPNHQWSGYSLKLAGLHLLGISPQFTPSSSMSHVTYREHAVYLCHDLLVTHRLHNFLWQGLSADLRRYSAEVLSPLTTMLCDMRWEGTAGDRGFMQQQCERLDQLMISISDLHTANHSIRLLDMTDDDCRKLLFKTYRLPHTKHIRKKPSIGSELIASLIENVASQRIRASLTLIEAFRSALSLRTRLRGFLKELHADDRFHSEFDNRQASGRLSSSKPNLQQIAKSKTIFEGTNLETTVDSRNLVKASEGHVLLVADVAQADVRVLAHEIDFCLETTGEHFRRLTRRRFQKLPQAEALWKRRDAYFNPNWSGIAAIRGSAFNPRHAKPLVESFLQSTGDFYSEVASQVTGRQITKSDTERNIWKSILLAQINSETPSGLSVRLKCTKEQAKSYVDKFFGAFPDIATWVALQQQQIALAGEAYTWAGRRRRNTPHFFDFF